MRQVTFARPQPPGYGVGDKALVPDALAVALEKAGDISASEPWPAGEARAPAKPMRPLVRPSRPAGAQLDSRIAG